MREAKILSQEITTLLGKLYNYRGEDSTRLRELISHKETAEGTKAKAEAEQADLKAKVADLEKKLESVKDEGEKLGEVLGSIHREDYAIVLDCLNIDFNPASLKEELDGKLPSEVTETTNEIKASKLTLKSVQSEINNASDEISKRTDEIVEERNIMAKLNEYVEIALTGNINVTREEITNLLKLFAFDEGEQKEIAKILMFPEDALIAYDNQKQGKTPPAKAEKATKEVKEEKNIFTDISFEQEPIIVEEETKLGSEIQLTDLDEIAPEKEVQPEVVETIEAAEPTEVTETIEEKKEGIELTKQDATAFLRNLLDVNLMPKKAIDMLRKDFDKELIQKNIEYTRSKKLTDDIYYKNPNLLMDSELRDKVEFLMNDLAKESDDILLNLFVLENYTKTELLDIKQRILALEIDPRQIPLYIYKMGLDNFLNNVKFFFEKGIRFDAKSISKQPFALALSTADNTKKLYDILGAYKMSITKQNGKNIIPVISKQANDLARELDVMIEMSQIDRYRNNPQEMVGEGL